jgi:hypothetical protein
MKDISEHCSDISKFISGYEPDIEWPNQFEWLNIASGIKKIEFDISRFDTSYGYCSNADQWHGAREELLEKYITELTRFSYVWGALESLIDDLNPPSAPDRGKINAICYYIKNRLEFSDIINQYTNLLTKLKETLEPTDVRESNILERFQKIPEYISQHGIGLFVIYKLRNQFAHGSISFPIPDEESRPKGNYHKMVLLSTRIVLLSMQMIWIAFYKNSGLKSQLHWEADEDKEYTIDLILALRVFLWLTKSLFCEQERRP